MNRDYGWKRRQQQRQREQYRDTEVRKKGTTAGKRNTNYLHYLIFFFSFYPVLHGASETWFYFHFRTYSCDFLRWYIVLKLLEHSHLMHNWWGQLPVFFIKGIVYLQLLPILFVPIFLHSHAKVHFINLLLRVITASPSSIQLLYWFIFVSSKNSMNF